MKDFDRLMRSLRKAAKKHDYAFMSRVRLSKPEGSWCASMTDLGLPGKADDFRDSLVPMEFSFLLSRAFELGRSEAQAEMREALGLHPPQRDLGDDV